MSLTKSLVHCHSIHEDRRLREKYFLLSHEMQDVMGLFVYVGE